MLGLGADSSKIDSAADERSRHELPIAQMEGSNQHTATARDGGVEAPLSRRCNLDVLGQNIGTAELHESTPEISPTRSG